jgi:hypothetical protein
VLGLNEKIERSLLKIFLSVLGLILLLGAVGYFGSSGGVDENTATDIVGKTNDSAQSGGGLHGDH